jgi:hypothetical protein
MTRKFILLIALIGFTVPASAQFNKAQGSTMPYQIFGGKMIRTSDGGFVQIGTNYNYNSGDFQVIRMNSSGAVLWKRHYGLATDMETAGALTQLNDGTIVIGGWTSFDGGTESSSYFIRIAPSNGYLYWSKVVPSPLGTPIANYAMDLCPTSDNGFIATGTWFYDMSLCDAYAFKMTSLGVLHWQHTYHFTDPVLGSMNSTGAGIRENADGTLIMTGSVQLQGAFLMKLTSTGTVLWTNKYNAVAGSGSGGRVLPTSDGGYIVTGSSTGKNYTFKTDGSGNLTWSRVYGTDAGGGTDVIQTSDGGYAVTGNVLLKLNSTGGLTWAQRYHGGILSVIELTTGEYMLAGGTNEFGFPQGALLEVKTDALGECCGTLPAIVNNNPHTTAVVAMSVSTSGPLTVTNSSPLGAATALTEVSMCNCTVDAGSDKTNQARNSCCVPTGCTSVSLGTPAIPGYTYLWTPSATLSCGGTCAQPNANPCATTTYKVTASGTGCLSSFDYVTVTSVVIDCCDPKRMAGPVDDDAQAAVYVYPNPAHNVLVIALNENIGDGQQVRVEVTDMQGKQMIYQEYVSDSHEYRLDITALSSGMYIVNVTTGENTMTQKVSVE